ncbi:MAG: transcriptional regulator [Chloroflexi bacterium]|nr:transcriptional regulator [Chloroflexota bacterium]
MSDRVPAGPPGRTDPPPPQAIGAVLRPTWRRTNGNGAADVLDAADQAILGLLCESGAVSPETVAGRLGLSRTGALLRLRDLADRGLVQRHAVRHGVGRPRHLYDVTPAGHARLPAAYDGLASTLLESIGAVGGEALVRSVLEARRRILAGRLGAHLVERLGPDAPLEARVRELAILQDEAGYLCRAGLATDGVIELREHHCAILGVIDGSDAVCRAEAELFAEVLDARVTRISHIPSGDRACAFRFEPRS